MADNQSSGAEQKKKSNPFGDAKPRELNISLEHEQKLAKKFEELDIQRLSMASKAKQQPQQSPQQPQQSPQQSQQQAQPAQGHRTFAPNQQQGGRPSFSQRSPHNDQQGGGFQDQQHQHQQHQQYQQQQQQQQQQYQQRSSNNGLPRSFQSNRSGNRNEAPQEYGQERPERPERQERRPHHDGDQQQGYPQRSSVPPPDYLCKNCYTSGHYLRDCPMGHAGGSGGSTSQRPSYNDQRKISPIPTPGYVCRLCGSQDHWIQDCPTFEPQQRAPPKVTVPPDHYICRLCNNPGHWMQNCSKFDPNLRQPHSGQPY